MTARSKFQQDVLKLYRQLLKTAKNKKDIKDDGTIEYIKRRFRQDVESVDRTNFPLIEHMMRNGRKQLNLLQMPGFRGATYSKVISSHVKQETTQ